MDDGGNGDTGGSDGNVPDGGWSDEDSDGLWGWLSGITDGLKTVWQAIVALPGLIAEPILDGIKAIFIPDAEYIDNAFNGFLNELKMKFGIDTGFFESLFQGESAVEDVKGNYTIPGVGTFNLTFLDASWIVDGVTFFRPFIRGFLVLLMMLYHVRQLLGFFGYDAGVVAGRTDDISANRALQRER